MKTISDIRLFRSTVPNTDGNPQPLSIGSRQLNLVLHRIVMKLREQNFSLGEFDHLYLNFTTQLAAGAFSPAARSVDPYHRWYRYYDVGTASEIYQQLDSESSFGYIIAQLKSLLVSFFAANNPCSVQEWIDEAVEKGEDMLVLYKTKQTPKLKASIFLQYLDSAEYLPHLFVWDGSGEELLHRQLAPAPDLAAIGEIQLSSKRVTIKPRKNVFTSSLSPYVFEIER